MQCRNRLWLILALFFPGASAIAAPIDPSNPPDGRFSDDWGQVFLAEQKVGYAHFSHTRKGDQITTSSSVVMKMGRMDQAIKAEINSSTVETIDGTPLRFNSVMKMAAFETTTSGEVHDGKVTLTKEQFGMKQADTYDFPEGSLMEWGAFRLQLLKGSKPGTTYEYKTYSPDLSVDKAMATTATIGDWEEINSNGTAIKAQKITATIDTPVGKLTSKTWMDKDANLIRSDIPMPGLGELSVIACDEAAALSDFLPPELFMNTVIEVKRKIDRAKARRIRYRLTAQNDEVDLSTLPDTGMQSVESTGKRSAELTVTRLIYKPENPSDKKRSTPDLSEYREPNLMINTADPELIALAKKAAGGVTEPFALADRLRKFVTGYIKSKDLNVGFASAGEVARNREGDCSEHGVLLAALGRINGLPSRVVVGLAYVPSLGGRQNIFGYHLWTQFYIDHRWIDFDAALAESDCSPARIAFATSSLHETGLADLSLPLLTKIGGIDIEIEEIDDGGAE